MNEMNEFSMSALHREILRKNRTTIIRDLIVDGVLLDFLVETKTLRDDMREHILVLNGTTEEQMKKFIIQDENIQVTYILKTSNNADAESASFKIRVEGSDLSPLMKPEFWPEGVHCMRLDSNRNVPANVYPLFSTKHENVQLVTPTESKLHQSESGLEQG
ncbi:hypothetical protein CAPTEDRAFT_199287 [Capitella teleta]|uniref:CARD domain-containing protein n=1 Tax=Capitella teleta TaxID=283909 RepID=R7T8H5_CAPTE|nr:hypothetical protein CAPTEDRAFT_199287 [Capitella teleta]|eukprot:ELT87690.1 hypothetical protein CAPTEDRAFT_199287 [Capitella teleta]